MMNQVNRVEFLGKQYPVNFSAWVLEQITARWGGLSKMQETLTKSEDPCERLSGTLFLMHCLLTAGSAYATVMGDTDIPSVPELELLTMAVPLSELKTVQTAAFAAMGAATKTSIEVEPGKNAAATLGQ